MHLVAYDIGNQRFRGKLVSKDQFFPHTLTLRSIRFLLVPTEKLQWKRLPPTPPDEGSEPK